MRTIDFINKLGKLGYIETVRGKNGGIRLGKPSMHINLGDVVRAIEALQIVNCSPEFCHITSACRLKNILANAKEAFLSELDKHLLSDLVENNPTLTKILNVSI